nr:hypothetical protein [Pirellulaceae bacterium]
MLAARGQGRCLLLVTAMLLGWNGTGLDAPAQDADYVSDPAASVSLTHRQDWGDFGLDTAAAPAG